MADLDEGVRKAIQHFWKTRASQAERQGRTTGDRDRGARAAATGGAHLDGFRDLLKSLLVNEGELPDGDVYTASQLELPGYFRPEKKWDLVVVVGDRVLGAVECKAQVGPSFGNNANNRAEEAVGNAHDYWTALREHAYGETQDPWLGYMMVLEEAPRSTSPVKVKEPHFKVAEVFRDVSYAKRYEVMLTRLLRERLYNGACLLLSKAREGLRGGFREPCAELSFATFARSFVGRAVAYARTRR